MPGKAGTFCASSDFEPVPDRLRENFVIVKEWQEWHVYASA
jgi:hypothetical protein